mgnify:CR=1 FL=1
MNRQKLNAKTLLPALFLMVTIDLAITSFMEKEYFRAQIAIPATVIDSILIYVILLFVLRFSSGKCFGRGLQFLLLLIMAFSCGCTLVRTEQFFRFTSDASYTSLAVYVVFLMLLFYVLRTGMEATIRLANLLIWPFAGSLILLIIAKAFFNGGYFTRSFLWLFSIAGTFAGVELPSSEES